MVLVQILPAYKLFCKAVSYIGSKMQRKVELVLKKKKTEATLAPICQKYKTRFFFLSTLVTNINYMG